MPDVNLTDHQLLALLRKGDEGAFTMLYDRYWKRLFVIAANKLDHLYVAEEMVQDIFYDLWNRRATLDVTGELQAYLAVALKYMVINYQVRLKREKAYKQNISLELKQGDHSTEQYLQFEELRKRLAALVVQLPARCQLTYRMSREMGLSHKEIAAELAISEKAVEHNLHRAKKTLRAGLSDLLTIFLPFL